MIIIIKEQYLSLKKERKVKRKESKKGGMVERRERIDFHYVLILFLVITVSQVIFQCIDKIKAPKILN